MDRSTSDAATLKSIGRSSRSVVLAYCPSTLCPCRARALSTVGDIGFATIAGVESITCGDECSLGPTACVDVMFGARGWA